MSNKHGYGICLLSGSPTLPRLWLLYVERRNGHSSTLVEKMQDMPGVRPPRSTVLEG